MTGDSAWTQPDARWRTSRGFDDSNLVANVSIDGARPLCEWVGDDRNGLRLLEA